MAVTTPQPAAAAQAGAAEKGAVTAACAFCGGKGKDPFDIMSSLSTCCVCGGRGVVEVPVARVRCAHCGGSGAVKTLTCTVCGGIGVVPAPTGATLVCPECNGAGDDASAPSMACLKCRGRGWVQAEAPKGHLHRTGKKEGAVA